MLTAGGVSQSRPMSLVLLIDVTASVSEAMATVRIPDALGWDGTGNRDERPKREPIKQPNAPRDLFLEPVLRTFIPGLSPGDRLRIGSVARVARFSPAFTADRAALERATRDALDVPEADRYSGTPIWDAIDAAVSLLEQQPEPRAIVLVTDGLSTGNRISLRAATDHAIRSRVAVSIVCEWWGKPRTSRADGGNVLSLRRETAWPWKTMQPFMTPPDVLLGHLADSTGGILIPDGADAADPTLAAALGKILAYLHRHE